MEELKQFRFDFYLLIPYYNNLSGLIRSLESISYDPVKYALLIVDDGSKIPLKYDDLAKHLPASIIVKIIRLQENKGITKAMNTGLEWLDDKKDFQFVARLDCGDLCTEDRFQVQVAFLRQHQDIDLVGSWCIFKDFSTGMAYYYRTPTEHENIVRGMYFRNIFRHSTVMWRAEITEKTGLYPYSFPHAEDYGFFYEILNKGKAAVIANDLVICDIDPNSISMHFRKEQLKSRIRVVNQYGKNRLLCLIGALKCWILMVIPYGIIQNIKKTIYRIKSISVN